MINRKLCIVVCCLGVGLSLVAQAQTAPDTSDDQTKALEALRQAEKGRLMATHPVIPATPVPVTQTSDPEAAKSIEALRHAEKPSPAATPAAAATAATANPEEDAKALEALREAEKSRLNTPPVAATPAPVAAAPSAPLSADAAQALQALRQAERQPATPAKSRPAQNVPAVAITQPAVTAQQEADAAREKQALADSEVAAHAKKVGQERHLVSVGSQEERDTAAATAALEQYQKNLSAAPGDANKPGALTALDRQQTQEEVARRVEALQAQIKSAPGGTPEPTASGLSQSKEESLRELLRRYNADEITPLEYHSERAKIVAEP